MHMRTPQHARIDMQAQLKNVNVYTYVSMFACVYSYLNIYRVIHAYVHLGVYICTPVSYHVQYLYSCI